MFRISGVDTRFSAPSVSVAEIDALLDIGNDGSDLSRIADTRSEIEALKQAIAVLPARPCQVLRGITVEGRSARQIADRLGIGVRTVERDLKLALTRCTEATVLTKRAAPTATAELPLRSRPWAKAGWFGWIEAQIDSILVVLNRREQP